MPVGDNFPGIHVGELPALPDGEDASCGVDSDEEYSDGDNGDFKEEVGDGCG